ncbi:MAG: class I SAM-dependent methyltransferase [Kiritimatiellae bacterium]|nr:class I SAM-dependent methyltransferase [Kiritimatiellia bacterium]MDW8459017.1 class I SAM-dependent methyltransferase [Verrucomicrobiota bacterium]
MKIYSCRSCGEPLHHVFIDLGASPLSNSYLKPEQLDEMEPFFPLTVRVCHRCWLVQLPLIVRPENIFTDYAYFSSFSTTWLNHCARYVDEVIPRFGITSESRVVELASNDGYLLQYFVQRGIPVLGVEPAANVALAALAKGIPTLVKFFGTETAKSMAASGLHADLLIGNNVFGHVPDLNDFIAGFKILLKPTGVITLEFPHLERLIEHNEFDTIYHEHFSYFSFIAAEAALARHGLRVFDVQELGTHGGSLRLFVTHEENAAQPTQPSVGALRDREIRAGFNTLEPYRRFAERVERIKQNLLTFLIEARRAGKKIAGYGAPAKGNTLLNYCGIRTDFIAFTVDKNPRKQGLYLPGTRIPVHPVDRIFDYKPDYLFILPWNLKDEVMQQMAGIRAWGGKFFVAIPDVLVFE